MLAGNLKSKSPPPEPNPYNRMERAFRNLPEDKRKNVQQQLNDARDLAAKQMEDLQKTKAEALAILTAPDFDAAAYTAKLNEMQDNWLNIGDHMGNTVVSLASQLNQAERKKMASALTRPSRSGAARKSR